MCTVRVHVRGHLGTGHKAVALVALGGEIRHQGRQIGERPAGVLAVDGTVVGVLAHGAGAVVGVENVCASTALWEGATVFVDDDGSSVVYLGRMGGKCAAEGGGWREVDCVWVGMGACGRCTTTTTALLEDGTRRHFVWLGEGIDQCRTVHTTLYI